MTNPNEIGILNYALKIFQLRYAWFLFNIDFCRTTEVLEGKPTTSNLPNAPLPFLALFVTIFPRARGAARKITTNRMVRANLITGVSVVVEP